MKRVAFCTFGCRLNQYDTETIRTLLEGQGSWQSVAAGDGADLYVVNTCSVTARADATARKAIRRIHQEHPGARIVVTGCYAQRAPAEVAELPGVALVLGAADRALVADKVAGIEPGRVQVAVSPITSAKTFLDLPVTEMMEHSRAFVKVQEGCDERCTFCIVPQTRGASRSRRLDSVVRQVRELIDGGYVEVVITGVHVGDYGLDLPGRRRRLVELLERLLDLPGLERLRLSSIEPASVSDELVELLAREPRFARHLHIPFQSGSDAVLERMRRRYTAAQFSELIWKIAERVPDCGIGADVICGFPGESDEDFQATFDRLAELPVTYLHPFSYSVRPGSQAEAEGDPVGGDVKKRRIRALKRLVADKNRAFRERHLGREVAVLLEPGRRAGAPRLCGWTDNYLRVDLGEGRGASVMSRVRITGVGDDGLIGERI